MTDVPKPPKPTRSVRPTVPDHPEREKERAVYAQIFGIVMAAGVAVASKSPQRWVAVAVQARGLLKVLAAKG